MKIVKIAVSPAMRENIPTRPREGSVQGVSVIGMVAGSELMYYLRKIDGCKFETVFHVIALLIPPVRIFRMLEVPKRPPALHFRNGREVVCGWRRRSRPFQSPGVPWIIAGRASSKVRPEQVESEAQHRRGLEQDSDGHDHVPRFPPSIWFIGVDAPRHSQNSHSVHEIKREVEPNKEEPKMPLAEGLIEHPPGHFGIPVIESAEEGKKDSTHDYVVEMSDHKIGATELPVEGRGSEHNSRQTGDEKLEQKAEAEQHGRGITDLSAPHRTQPVEDLDAGRHGNGHACEHEEGV